MKKVLILIIIGLLINSCSSKKKTSDGTKYYNQKNKEISENKFNRENLGANFVGVEGDFSNHRKLIARENKGKITNRPFLVSLLEKGVNKKLDTTKPLVMVYLQNRDSCISGVNLVNEDKVNWFARLEDGIKNISKTKTTPIYVYRENDESWRSNGKSAWYNDSDFIVEKLFFREKYPCTRIVIVQIDGTFVSYIARIKQDYIWQLLGRNDPEVLKSLLSKVKSRNVFY